jgi:uncharacterized protein (DUF2384 family)
VFPSDLYQRARWLKNQIREPATVAPHTETAPQMKASTMNDKPSKQLDPADCTSLQRALFIHAAKVFGSEGNTWMTKPHALLGGKSPKEYATNEASCSHVLQILNAIKHGGVV